VGRAKRDPPQYMVGGFQSISWKTPLDTCCQGCDRGPHGAGALRSLYGLPLRSAQRLRATSSTEGSSTLSAWNTLSAAWWSSGEGEAQQSAGTSTL